MARSRSRAANARSSRCPSFRVRAARRSAEARIEEARGTGRSDRHRRRRGAAVPRAHGPAGDACSARARSRRSPKSPRQSGAGLLIVDARADARSSRRTWRRRSATKVIDRTGLDPRDFRRARRDRRRPAAGRARAPRLPGRPPGAELDPPRAAARRFRLPRRPRRDPDRSRPADDPRPNGEDPARARSGEADPRRCTATGGSVRRGRWLRSSVIRTPESPRFSIA